MIVCGCVMSDFSVCGGVGWCGCECGCECGCGCGCVL